MEKDAVKITVTYEPETETIEITAEMIAMSGKDLYTVVSAAIEMGVKLGMFNTES